MSTENATDASNNITTASLDEIAAMVRADVAVGTHSPVGWLPPVRELNTVMLIAAKLGRGKMTPEERLHKMLAGRELGIPAIAAMDQLDLIEGKISLPSYMMKARAERLAGVRFKKLVHTETECVMTATRVHPDGEIETAEATWTEARAKQAGLLGKKNWKNDPRSMMQWRCVSELVRWIASEVLQGCCAYSREEMGAEDETEELIDVEFKSGDAGGGNGGGGPSFAGWKPAPANHTNQTAGVGETTGDGAVGGVGSGDGDLAGTESVASSAASKADDLTSPPVTPAALPPVADVTPPAMATDEQIAQATQYITAGVLTMDQWKQVISQYGVTSIRHMRKETADALLERIARWSMREGQAPWESNGGTAAEAPKEEAARELVTAAAAG